MPETMFSITGAGLLGWICGGLINYLADVLPARRRLTLPFCLACEAPGSWFDYCGWPRRCPACQHKRGMRSWLVALFSIIAATYLWINPHPMLQFYVSLLLLVFFGLVIVIDLEHRLILHMISLAGVFLGVGIGISLHGFWNTLLGGAAGFTLMYILFILGGLIAKLLARWRHENPPDDALGFGDVNLAGVVGLLLGWPGIIAGLVFAILMGGISALVYYLGMIISRRYQVFAVIPYGPNLVIAAAFLLYFRTIF